MSEVQIYRLPPLHTTVHRAELTIKVFLSPGFSEMSFFSFQSSRSTILEVWYEFSIGVLAVWIDFKSNSRNDRFVTSAEG
jgi:hypothetical protein